jgi:hypothetical protein
MSRTAGDFVADPESDANYQERTQVQNHDQQEPRQALTSAANRDPPRERRPRSVRASRLHKSAGLPCLHAALSERRGLPRPSGPLPVWPPRHPDLGGAGRRAGGARGTQLRRRRAPALGPGGGLDRALVRPQSRRPRARHRQRLSSHPKILRRRARPLWHRHQLLRSAHRRRHRRSDPAQHARGLRGIARIAVLRHPGRARYLFARWKKASICRFNPAPNISAAIPT